MPKRGVGKISRTMPEKKQRFLSDTTYEEALEAIRDAIRLHVEARLAEPRGHSPSAVCEPHFTRSRGMTEKAPRVTAGDMIKALERGGFSKV